MKFTEEGVKYLLKDILAVPGNSPRTSRCLMVNKEERNKLMFHIHYRKIIMVTLPDAYPLPLRMI